MTTAIVVGSGPNGLAAAVHLARAGLDVTVLEAAETIGGGTRSGELTVPGLIHDHCSAVHPLAAGSPFLRTLGLERHGLVWRHAPIDCAHPLDGGAAALLHLSIKETAAGLGADGPRWRALFSGPAGGFDALADDVLRPVLHVPRHPARLAAFGARALLPAATAARALRTRAGRALFGGLAAHAFTRLDRPASSAVGLMIAAAGHRYGWPVAEGGSAAIARALAAELAAHGGRIHTGVPVRSMADLPPADCVLLDIAPAAAAGILGDALPPAVARAYRRFRHGPGAFGVNLAVEGGIPWADPRCRTAATVHVGGEFAEVAAAERAVVRGRMPARPFVLVAQQHVADPTRSRGDVHPVDAYAHVPAGYDGDATEAILGQLERFAPGFRERIVARRTAPPRTLAAGNPNLVGGDITGGANSGLQLVFRPRVAADPYATGAPGVYLCSASTPPGAGAHGMCGYGAAESALRRLRAGGRG